MLRSTISAIFAVLASLSPVPAFSQSVSTTGECSPAIVDNSGGISVNCYIDDVPLESVVRQGHVIALMDAISSGISPETVLQGFVLGNPRSLAGVSFFKRVDVDELQQFLILLQPHVDLNSRIFFNDTAFVSLMSLAKEAGRIEPIMAMAKSGMSIHAPHNPEGGKQTSYLLPELFPVLDMVRNGVLDIGDEENLRHLFEHSFFYPEFSTTWEDLQATGNRRVPHAFSEEAKLQNSIAIRVGIEVEQDRLDFGNATSICNLARKGSNFDWCERLRDVPRIFLSDDPTGRNTGWPPRLEVLALLTIRDDMAKFLIHHTRASGDVGILLVPKNGNQYFLGMWDSEYGGGTPCWSDRFQDYSQSCWGFYSLEADIFNPDKLTGRRGWPVYTASEERIEF